MSEIKVICPGCESRFKLAKQVDQVRCPKCKEVFCPDDHLAESSRESAPSPPVLKRQKFSEEAPSAPVVTPRIRRVRPTEDDHSRGGDQFSGSTDSEGDDSDYLPVKKKSKSKKSRSGSRARETSGGIDADQIISFGGILIALGVGAFVLPLIGLQIKGLHAMSAEMQAMGGMLFFLVGGLFVAIGLGKKFLGRGFSTLLTWGKRGVYILGGGLVLLILAPLVLIPAIRMVASLIPRPQPDAGLMQQQPGAPAPYMPPGWVMGPNGVPIPPGAPGNPNRPGPVGRPAAGPGNFRSLEQQFAEYGPQKTVTIQITAADRNVHFGEIQKQLASLDPEIKISSGTGGGNTYTSRLAPVEDINGYAARITLGKVTSVDTRQRVITLELP